MIPTTNIYRTHQNRTPFIHLHTEDDISPPRVRTTQISAEHYIIEGSEFEIYDVAGKRSTRHTWIDYFENIEQNRMVPS